MPLISRQMLAYVAPGEWTEADIAKLGRPKRRTITVDGPVFELWPIERVLDVAKRRKPACE